MILPNLTLQSRANQSWKFSGLDHISQCLDKQHFLSYPYNIEYNYNSRGFRDQEWPKSIEALKDAIWCIGDSFTVGLGSPVEHTWVYKLSELVGQRTINVSMDGASNEWISRIAQEIVKTISPKKIVIMWSYTHRRELKNKLLSNEDRRSLSGDLKAEPNWQNLLNCKNRIDTITNSVQFAIPNFCPSLINLAECWESIAGPNWPNTPPTSLTELNALPQWILTEIQELHNCLDQICYTLKLKNVIQIPQQDLARDGHHFDLITAKWVAACAAAALKM